MWTLPQGGRHPQKRTNNYMEVRMTVDRREFMGKMLLGAGAACLFPLKVFAKGPCDIQHPLMPPNKTLAGQCHNCGMTRPMWARTWFTYENSQGAYQVCSFHCLAETALMAGEEPKNVKVALYRTPDKMIPANQAYFVIGSKAKGTMTMVSKPAFASEGEAKAFSDQCGGKVARYPEALKAAKNSIDKENQKIAKNRKRKGKIVEPVANQDKCPVCGMYAAKYPKNKCQIQSRDKTVYHFCSTQCMFEFLKNSNKYVNKDVQPFLIWVVDFEGGQWIYGKSAYYVVGSSMAGPMGKEAFPFINLSSAGAFAKANKGKVLRFYDVTVDKIME